MAQRLRAHDGFAHQHAADAERAMLLRDRERAEQHAGTPPASTCHSRTVPAISLSRLATSADPPWQPAFAKPLAGLGEPRIAECGVEQRFACGNIARALLAQHDNARAICERMQGGKASLAVFECGVHSSDRGHPNLPFPESGEPRTTLRESAVRNWLVMSSRKMRSIYPGSFRCDPGSPAASGMTLTSDHMRLERREAVERDAE